jgi:hypothetical protein
VGLEEPALVDGLMLDVIPTRPVAEAGIALHRLHMALAAHHSGQPVQLVLGACRQRSGLGSTRLSDEPLAVEHQVAHVVGV